MDGGGMSGLPTEEQRTVWDETEQNFWERFDKDNDINHAGAEAEYQRAVMDVKIDLGTLTGRRTQLIETQERMSKELTKVEEALAHVGEACDDKATALMALERQYQQREQEKLQKHRQIATTMERFFRMKRGEDPNAPSERDRNQLREPVRSSASSRQERDRIRAAARLDALHQANQLAKETHAQSPIKMSAPMPPVRLRTGLVDIVDADSKVVGPVERVEPWNQWVEAIQKLPIKRKVKIRRGRKFTPDHLAMIYDRSEAKGVRWLACMIQATGEIQPQRCHSCDKNQGAFDDCIVVGGPLFQKCGNCEWNRQGCHTPLSNKSPNAVEPDPDYYAHRNSSGKDGHHLPLRGFSGIQEQRRSLPPARDADAVNGHSAYNQPFKSKPPLPEPEQMPTPKEHKEHHFVSSTYTPSGPGGFTPANAKSRPQSREILTPSVRSIEASPQPTPNQDLEEITRSNLVLRHDGTVYTYPECVEGVPLAKIDEKHPYWEPRWPPVKSVIEPQLESWREKYEIALQAKAKGETGSAKFQTGRQVNRGIKILEYLQDGEISPYQLLSKKYTHTGKGAITSYDTLFRMCETLGELAKFRLGVSPVEWLRQRLHEILMQKGSHFNYAKTIHDFYHDEKLAALRAKNGYKSIGRPSGYKAPATSTNSASGTPLGMKKRKSLHSQTDISQAASPTSQSPLTVHEDYECSPTNASAGLHESNSFGQPLQKRLKPPSPIPALPNDEFYTESVSDADSWSGAPLEKLDWRIYQVKTRDFTSSTNVTQYWHWKEGKRQFEHQVLRETNPVAWGILRTPIDFNVPLDDIVQVAWNMDALQVHLVTSRFGSAVSELDGKPRGDIMASFKRETTMRRFLSYCRQRRLKVVKISP